MVVATRAPLSREIVQLLDRRSNTPALIVGGRTWSYAEIRNHTDRVVRFLRDQGVVPGLRVGLVLGNVPEFLCVFLAVAELGGSAVLLSTYFRERELKQYFGALGLGMVLSTEAFGAMLSAASADLREEPMRVEGLESLRLYRIARIDPQGGEPGPEGELVVQFTSGVGGISKIIGRTRANIADEIRNFSTATDLGESDRILCMTPLFHAYGLVNGFLPAWFRGACLMLAERFLPRDVLALATAHRPTMVLGVPLMYELLVQLDQAPREAFAAARFCFSAGAKLHPRTAQAFLTLFGRPIGQLYGSTETGVIAFNHDRLALEYPAAVGLAVGGREIAIVGDDGRECGSGRDGEIRVRSGGTTPFYIGATELTAKAFRDGWYHTGDVGFRDENGLVHITGRKSAFINVGGMKVDPFEVEAVLRSIPGVSDVAVVGLPRGDSLYSGEVVKAFVVSTEPLSRKSLLNQCRAQMAEYKIPREIEFVAELPRSPMGKVLKKYLVESDGAEDVH